MPTAPSVPAWLRRTGAWLRRVPIDDPVDRRNAPALQVLLIFLGVEIPLNKGYHLLSGHVAMGGARLAVDIGTDLAITAAAWSAVWMIRRGRLKPAIATFVAVVMCCAVAANLAFGYQLQAFDPYPMVMLTLAALVIGRRALWIVYLCIPAVFALGMASPWGRDPAAAGRAFQNLPSLAFSYLMIAIVLDRTVAALRETLWKAQRSAQRLRVEMQERERMRERLLHMQKIESVGHLASGVSHDFNNILGAIIGYASERHRLDELDFDPETDARRLGDALEGVELAAQRGVAVSRKLLSFGRRELAVPTRFDAAQALRELQPMLRQLFDGRVRVSLDLPDAPVRVHLDRSQFDLVMLNFAANARDAMPGGGEFALRAREEGDAVRIVVADTGSGMPPEVMRQAFEPFFTTKPPGEGTGLGLAVAREMAEQAGGTLEVDSAPGAGARFTLRLPRAADRPGPLP
ncbi:histidine kinase [Luteimonas sp. Y-2-2-4F]|nr:ATP-binding protein [Luteimonas sp. Y-2-2-4F]MCD9031893.1 histidine kinase [Luteimonas sp. Y-2-2-4F]